MLAKMWKNGNPVQHWWEQKTVRPLWKTISQKIKHRMTVRPSNSIPGYVLKENEGRHPNGYLYPMFLAALFITAEGGK